MTNNEPHSHDKHPVFRGKPSLGERAADIITHLCGTWKFIFSIFVFIGLWMYVNISMWINGWDPYPFILLNFILSCLAALQAPIILMSQNREAKRDRIQAKYDYLVNRKAEREIKDMQKDLEDIKELIKETHRMVKKNNIKNKK